MLGDAPFRAQYAHKRTSSPLTPGAAVSLGEPDCVRVCGEQCLNSLSKTRERS